MPDAPDLRVTTPSPSTAHPRTRIVAGLVAVALVATGLAVSRVAAAVADPVGDGLYAAFIYALLVVVAPRARPPVVALVAFALCALVELAQLTGMPAAAVDAVPVLRYALGTTFVAVDLVAYAAGAAVAFLVQRRAAPPSR